MEPLVEIKNLSIRFPEGNSTFEAVKGISFSIGKGEIVGVVGESGSGKSMSALALMGLLPKDAEIASGSLCFQGEDLVTMKPEKRRQLCGSKMAMVFQEPMTSLNPVFRIGEQVDEIVALHNPTMSKEEVKARTIEMLKLVGIANSDGVYRMYPHELSGGMRQRICIAIGLACNPRLIIADEPTTALDVTIQAQILDLIRGLNEQMNTSVLFITHDLGVVSELCDTVIVMYTGRIVEKAPVRELFSDPKHPYTVGLMSAIPRITKDRPPLETIEGVVPNPTEQISGCSFWPRCPHATEQCKQGEPPVVQLSEERQVRCWLYADAAEKKEG